MLYIEKANVKKTEEPIHNLFHDKKQQLDKQEKDNLFAQIVKSGRRRRIVRWSKTFAILVLCSLSGLWLYYQSNIMKESPSLSVVEVSEKHKELVRGKEETTILSADARGNAWEIYKEGWQQMANLDSIHIDAIDTREAEYTTIYVPYGSRKEIIMSDGSKVWLNAGSLFTFRNNMLQHDRETYLDGEGYFDIATNGKPFTIHTFNSEVKVLGTSFNLSSYEEDKMTSLDLITGKVRFSSRQNKFKAVDMEAGQRISYDETKNVVTLDRNSKGNDIMWTKKQLVLDNSKLPYLISRLEKIYNVEIVFKKKIKDDEPYSGRLNLDVDVVTALKSIYEFRNYEIRLEGRRVVIQ